MKKDLAVFFPGTGYTCGEALLVQLAQAFERRGYEVAKLDFQGLPFQEVSTLKEAAELAKPAVQRQLAALDPAGYGEIVFVSKSLGTVCAGWLEGEWGVCPRQLYLTPLPETLQYIRPASRVAGMVLGTQDRFLSAEALRAFCAQRGIPCLIAPGTGHSLKYEDGQATRALDRKIIEFGTAFLGPAARPGGGQ